MSTSTFEIKVFELRYNHDLSVDVRYTMASGAQTTWKRVGDSLHRGDTLHITYGVKPEDFTPGVTRHSIAEGLT